MRLEVEALAGGGRGVARADGRVVFVAGGLPGELVEARVERERAGIVEARATAVLRASPWREPEPCPVAERCGGCDLAHLRRDAPPLRLRSDARLQIQPLVERHFDRIGGALGVHPAEDIFTEKRAIHAKADIRRAPHQWYCFRRLWP